MDINIYYFTNKCNIFIEQNYISEAPKFLAASETTSGLLNIMLLKLKYIKITVNSRSSCGTICIDDMKCL